MAKIKALIAEQKNQLSLPGIIFIYLSRVIFLLSCFIAPTPLGAVFSIISFLLTYLIDFCHLISKESSFLKKLSHRITAVISVSSLVSCFIGQILGILSKAPDYDIVMSAVTGVSGTLFGYYVTKALKEITNTRDCAFTVSSSLFISGTVIFFREMLEFFCDYLLGTNFVHAEQIGDDHWFFRLLGLGSNIPQQRPLFDTDEDMLISLLVSAVTAVVLYIFLRSRNKHLFIKQKKEKFSFEVLPKRITDKICTEVEKVKAETNIYDILTWWLTRAVMIYAAILMKDPLEKALIIANLLATFAITLIHLVFPRESLFCKINYRLQSWLCLIVFTGSYMGNFIFVYNNLPRFDLFLHFISGPIAVAGGYYTAKTFMKPDTKHNILLISVYAFCLSCFIMPFWEVFEFCGDFLFGTANQGFYWGPTDNSFFFKLFGRGVGNTMLYYLFDTVYDVLLAFFTTVVSVIWLYISLLRNLRKEKALVVALEDEKEKITSC